MSSISLFSCLSLRLFIQSTICAERIVKGDIAGHSHPVTCSFCCYVICQCYTSFAPQQEKFRARTLRATTAAPPHAVLRESLLCVNVAAEMGVCSDVNAIYLSLSFFSSATDAYCYALHKAEFSSGDRNSCCTKIAGAFTIRFSGG